MDAMLPRKKNSDTRTGEAEPQFISVRIICGSCQNLNRQARRACTKCDHTGFEGERQIKQAPGQPVKLGGVMPDMTKAAPPEPGARTLQPSKP